MFSTGLQRVQKTLSKIKDYATLRNFLFAYFVYMMASIRLFSLRKFCANITNFSLEELAYFYRCTNYCNVRCVAIWKNCRLVWDKTNASCNSLRMDAYNSRNVFIADKISFFLIGGSADYFSVHQALSRSIMSQLTPEDHRANFLASMRSLKNSDYIRSTRVGVFLRSPEINDLRRSHWVYFSCRNISSSKSTTHFKT